MDSRFNREKQKDLNEQHSKILKSLMARPENKKCADCRKKDPRWASWNLGVFMCIQCSGIHRSIGTHISKVKSADLDTWTPEQIENMIKWGNEKANLYWEHAWPKDVQPSDKNMDNFIRAKYERKQYCMPGGIPDPSSLGTSSASISVEVATKSVPSAIVNGAPAASQNATLISVPAAQGGLDSNRSASQQLFEAFAAPPSNNTQQQAQKSFKDSIMSMYSSSPTTGKPPATTPQQNTFGDFSAFQSAPPVASNPPTSSVNPPPTFDAFSSLTSTTSANVGSSGIPTDLFSAPINNQGPAKTVDPFASLTSATSAPLASKASQPFDAFASLSINPAPVPATTSNSAFGGLSTLSNSGFVNPSLAKKDADDGFGDFTTAAPIQPVSKPIANNFASVSNDKPQTSSSSGWTMPNNDTRETGWTTPLQSSIPSASAAAPLQSTLPDHSRASTGFGDVQTNNVKPVTLSTLPPIDDPWSDFQ